MKIVRCVFVPIKTGFFVDDQMAIRSGAPHDGFLYVGSPVTKSFKAIREPGEAVSILLELSDGQIAVGDCATVQYAAVGGRESVLRSGEACEVLQDAVAPWLKDLDITTFRDLSSRAESLRIHGKELHVALQYGLSQALLDAVAKSKHQTMAEVVREEYATNSQLKARPMFVQCGDDRYDNVDKMILKQVGVLPHGLVNNVATKFGDDGEIFKEYVSWVRNRVVNVRANEQYNPVLHFDLYGSAGEAFNSDVEKVADYLNMIGQIASPFEIRIEHPIDAGSRDNQIKVMSSLRIALAARKSRVQLVVDEWCNTLEDIRLFVEAKAADVIHVKTPDLGGVNNTIEALLLVRASGLSAYCGGTCNETERSAQVSAHIAMACDVVQVLAKPGMGVDEGLMIVGNEMARVEALTQS